jgi:hypothetical protein
VQFRGFQESARLYGKSPLAQWQAMQGALRQ